MNRQVTSKICLIPLTRFYCFKVLFDIFYHQWGEEPCFVQCIPRTSLCRGSFYRGFTVLLPQRDFWYHPPPPSPMSCLELKLSSLTFLERFYPLKTLTPPSQIFFLMTLLAYVQSHPTTPNPRKRKGWEGALLPFSLFWRPGGRVFLSWRVQPHGFKTPRWGGYGYFLKP